MPLISSEPCSVAISAFHVALPYRGTLLISKTPPPWDHCGALGIVLLCGPRGGRFAMSEAPMYCMR